MSTFGWTPRVVALALAVGALPVHAADPIDPDARIIRLERWIKASINHVPGTQDDPLTEVSLWSNYELRLLRVDQAVLAKAWHTARDPDSLPAKQTDEKGIPPYTSPQVRQLIGLIKSYRGRNEGDAVLVRGALLHGDVAMSNPPTFYTPVSDSLADQRFRVQVGDGESLGFNNVSSHWDLARSLFDLVPKNSAAADVARRWYIATGMWTQNIEQHDTAHLRHARVLFPDDADIQYLSGCQQEAYASPPIQAVARTAVLPQGYHFDIASEADTLKNAEGFLRRALQLNPQHPEARLHLGHVLLARGRAAEAAVELRQFTPPADDQEMQYFAAMFLGAAEDGAGRPEEARAAYEHALQIMPSAQSPLFALASLARRRGDRAGSMKYVQQVFDLPRMLAEPADPWWHYRTLHTRATLDLLFELYRPFVEQTK